MYSCKLTVVSVTTTGENETKDFNGVNPNYIGSLGTPYQMQPVPEDQSVIGTMLPNGYSSFWEWADAVGRGINSLTTNSYNDSRIQAVFSVNQEVD